MINNNIMSDHAHAPEMFKALKLKRTIDHTLSFWRFDKSILSFRNLNYEVWIVILRKRGGANFGEGGASCFHSTCNYAY